MFGKVVFATRNPDKVRELRELFAGLGISLLGLGEFPEVGELPETGATMAENAVMKAKAASTATGLPCIGDDSGLEVDVLGGAPGVRSHRFAGEKATYDENNALLLGLLKDVPDEQRTARFRCSMALAMPGGETEVVEGICEGVMARERKGGGGFGYDPLFLLPYLGRTMAELDPGEKNRISHRGNAARRMREVILRRIGKSE